MNSTDEEFLENLLKKITSDSRVLPDEYSRLTTLFTPTSQSSTRAKAFVVLSSVCEHHRRSSPNSTAEDDPGTHNILHLFLPSVGTRMTVIKEQPVVEALSFIAALFAVDWRSAATIFSRSGFQDSMMDILGLLPSSAMLPSVISGILSSACGYKSCRESLSPRCAAWLESVFRQSTDVKLRSTSALALLKATQGAPGTLDSFNSADEYAQAGQRREILFKALRDALANSSQDHARDVADVVEGLAYLSTISSFKDRIVDDEQLLKKVMSFRSALQQRQGSFEDFGTTPFGLAVLIANLCSYRPQLSEEQAQVERLKRITQPRGGEGSICTSEDEFDDDEHVRSRARHLVAFGSPELLVAISRATNSAATRSVVGKALLGLIEDKENRGKILQAGGAKTLMTIIQASQQPTDPQSKNPLTKANMDFVDLVSIQALAKLAITSSPMQVFGPDENVTIEAIRPFACLLLHPSSKLLQRFEAMMALTNIASIGPELAERIAQVEGLLGKLEFLLLDENHLVRRAATELSCNLISGSELAFNRFSGDGGESSEVSTSVNAAKSRLHVLTALADVEDEPTRLAASGALAIVTSSAMACKLIVLLEFEHHRVLPVFRSLIDPSDDGGQSTSSITPNPGLVHRGVICVRNVLLNLSDNQLRDRVGSDVARHGVVNALTKVLKSAGQSGTTEAVLRPAAEALKWLMDSGVNVLP